MVEDREITVCVLERDVYARQAIVGYLSWDRRTRVVGQAATLCEMLLASEDLEANPDAAVLDTSLASDGQGLEEHITLLRRKIPGVEVVCLAHCVDPIMALAAAHSGARGYLVRSEVGIALASAICFALRHPFVVTRDVAPLLTGVTAEVPISVEVLPERRKHPHLTQRLEQALSLCVIEGMPAEAAAEEMGVSTSTVRSYIKEGYRILEAEDHTPYPPSMSPAEQAFARYSALDLPDDSPEKESVA